MIDYREFAHESDETEWVFDFISDKIQRGDWNPGDVAILCRTNRKCQEYLRRFSNAKTAASKYNFQVKTHEPEMQVRARNILSLLGVWEGPARNTKREKAVALEAIILDSFCFDLHLDKSVLTGPVEKLPYPCVPAVELPFHCKDAHPVLYERLSLLRAIGERGMGGIGMLIDKMDDLGITASLLGEDKRLLVHEIMRIQERCRELVKGGALQDFLEWLDGIGLDKAVTVSTAHRSKGHEYKVIFMVGCVENTWPHYYAVKAGVTSALDDEMRLFYVGCTRAEDCLYLTSYRTTSKGWRVNESEYIHILRQLGVFKTA